MLKKQEASPDLLQIGRGAVTAIGNCHRLQKNRHIEADMMALHVTANWRLCFKVHPTCLEIVDVCDYH